MKPKKIAPPPPKKAKRADRAGRKQNKSRTPLTLIIVLIVLVLLGGAGWFVLDNYAIMNGALIDRDSTALVLPEGELPDVRTLGKFSALQTLDLRGRTDVTTAYVDTVVYALPSGCKLLWTIALTDGAFDSDTAVLTLPGCTEADLALLPYFTELTRVDASGSGAYAALFAAANENSDIAFTYALPVGDAVLSNLDSSLTAKGVTDVSVLSENLPFFPQLHEADLRGGTVSNADMRALIAAYPAISFRFSVQVGGKTFDNDATVLDLAGVRFESPDDAVDALSCFPALTGVDLRTTGLSTEDARAVKDALSPLPVRYDVAIGDALFDAETEVLDLRGINGAERDAFLTLLSDFTALKTVFLPNDWTDEAFLTSCKAVCPDALFAREIELFGKTVSTADTEVDFSGTKIADVETLEAALVSLPALEKCIVCNTPLTNEHMETLMAAHPNIRFVWTIQLGPHKLRTDAIGFSTKNPSKYTSSKSSDEYNRLVRTTKRLKAGDIEALKYCTDLVALDLGHNYLTNDDLAVIGKLDKLQILILADNKITDISALSGLKELKYIELFMNKIPDLSPLSGLTSLVDVNVCNIGLTDLTPLYALTNAERLWYAMNPASREDKEKLANAMSNVVCNYTTRDETGEGWREHERYKWMLSFFD